MKLIFLLGLAVSAGAQRPPDVARIMSRVGINQARSLESRQQWIYTQKQHLVLRRGNNKVAREERREYTIAPKIRGFDKKLTHFEGKYAAHGEFVAYGKPGYQYKDMDIDGELIDDMSKDMTGDRSSRDGIARGLFPLTYHQQLKYTFHLVREETYRGRPVYRVTFEPRRKPHVTDSGEGGVAIWKGEALIDAQEFQPVLVTTSMALKIPFAVKALLGTNITGLGFAVEYKKFADGMWFPVSYGGEFEIRAVFFYKRKISVAVANSDFRRTDVNSKVAYTGQDK